MWSMWSVKEMWSKSRVFQSLGENMWSKRIEYFSLREGICGLCG